ncbi:MAG TPA: hypothetical protein DCG33_00730 [Prevotellaceae bacterium]|nr:hypothetical protein [Prevotellaceae bacterium]
MFTLKDYPNVIFLNFRDKNEVKKFVYGDGTHNPEPLYKYAQWNYAKKSLAERYLWMSNPSKWNDPFEDYFLKAQYIDTKGIVYDFPFKNNVFCNCLTPDHNSEAHWIAYAKKKEGVSLRIYIKELVERLNNFGLAHPEYKIYIGRVSYLNNSQIQSKKIIDIPLLEESLGHTVIRDINKPDFCANLLLLKRNSFKHDNEIRLIFIRHDSMFIDELDGMKFQYNYDDKGIIWKNYDNEKLISRVFTSPFYSMVIRDKIRHELEKKKYGFNRYDVLKKSGNVSKYSRIQRSRLYDKIKPHKIYI